MCNCEECEFKVAIQGFFLLRSKSLKWTVGLFFKYMLCFVFFFLIGMSWVLGRDKGRITHFGKWATSQLCLPLESRRSWDPVRKELLQRKASVPGSRASPSPLHSVSSIHGTLELMSCLEAFSNTSFTICSYRVLFLRIREERSAPYRIWAVIKADTDWHIVKLCMYHLLLDNTGHPLLSLD